MNYEELKKKFGFTSSWAVWNGSDPSDATIIKKHEDDLRSDVIIVGLNVSKGIKKKWQNFHGGKHDRKLMKLFNKSSYRGAYMTDIIKKYPESDSRKVDLGDRKLIEDNVEVFREEMDILGAAEDSLFILFGNKTKELFINELVFYFNNLVSCKHYSYYGQTDESYVKETTQKLEEHYKKTKVIFGTKEFEL